MEINTGTWPLRLADSQILNKILVMSPKGPGPKKNCAGEAQQQLSISDPSSRHGYDPVDDRLI
jgi:hypothetical protein